MDCFSAPDLLTVAQAQQLLVDAMSPVTDIERISITDADKRIIAQDVVSPINVPQHCVTRVYIAQQRVSY